MISVQIVRFHKPLFASDFHALCDLWTYLFSEYITYGSPQYAQRRVIKMTLHSLPTLNSRDCLLDHLHIRDALGSATLSLLVLNTIMATVLYA